MVWVTGRGRLRSPDGGPDDDEASVYTLCCRGTGDGGRAGSSRTRSPRRRRSRTGWTYRETEVWSTMLDNEWWTRVWTSRTGTHLRRGVSGGDTGTRTRRVGTHRNWSHRRYRRSGARVTTESVSTVSRRSSETRRRHSSWTDRTLWTDWSRSWSSRRHGGRTSRRGTV